MRNKGLKWFACCRFDDLVRRFERPDGRNRWDSQLFEINPSIGWFFSSVLNSLLTLMLNDTCYYADGCATE
jgi:hypothetical protein